MLKKMFAVMCMSLIAMVTMAQDGDKFYFDDHSDKSREDYPGDYVSHWLGDEIAFKQYVLKKTYTYKIEATPTTSEKTQVEKATIYYSVKKMNRYYKKQVKKGVITQEEAQKRYLRILNIAISIKSQNTEKFEEALKKAGKPNMVEKIFDRVVLQ